MKNLFKLLFPSKKQKEAEKLDFSKQMLYAFGIHPNFYNNSSPNVAGLLLEYKLSIEAFIEEAIEMHKDKIGYEPFKNHANVGGIFCDDLDKDNPIYVKLRYNIFYNNNAYSKYVVEMLELKTISLDEYLDCYNDGLKSGMIPKDSKQQ